jgi:nucleoid DNA-binding protein
MFNILYKYLIQHKSVALPGLGILELQTIPAISNFLSRAILPPSYKVILNDVQDAPAKSVFQYIAAQTGLSEWEAIKQLNDFSFQIKYNLKEGKKVVWEKVGEFSMEDNGATVFTSSAIEYDFMPPVSAVRVIRNTTNHTIRRGDIEVSESFFNPHKVETTLVEKNKKWWIGAVILAAIGIGLILFYFYNNGFDFSRFFNNVTPVVKEAPATYR